MITKYIKAEVIDSHVTLKSSSFVKGNIQGMQPKLNNWSIDQSYKVVGYQSESKEIEVCATPNSNTNITYVMKRIARGA